MLANAWTGLLQHDRKARGADDAARVEKRVHSNLFGLNAERSVKAYEKALTLVG